MAALSAARNTQTLSAGGVPVLTTYGVAASTIVYAGSMVAINAGGYLVPASTSASLICVGMATKTVDNSAVGSTNGGLNANVQQGVAQMGNGNSITLASVGALAYMVDDQTVSTNASGKSIAGTIYMVDSTGVWVFLGLTPPQASAATLTSNLASTATALGASLVGLAPSAGTYSGATVQAALAQVGKQAIAALNIPVTTPVILSTATTAQVVMRFLPKYAGMITALEGQVIVPVTTTAKLATFSPLISAVACTGGVLAVTSTSLATLGARVSGTACTGSNVFAAGQEITVTANTVTTFAEGQLLLQMYLDAAS